MMNNLPVPRFQKTGPLPTKKARTRCHGPIHLDGGPQKKLKCSLLINAKGGTGWYLPAPEYVGFRKDGLVGVDEL